MRKRLFALAGATASVLTLWGGSAAQAHSMTYPWSPGCGAGWSQCGYSKVSSDHRTVTACDTYADGAGFWTEYVRSDGASGYIKDGNGSEAGCGSGTTPSGMYIDRFRPCRNMSYGLVCLEDWMYVS